MAWGGVSGSASLGEEEMGRRRRKPGDPISLFPFLSILACVIGTLTLIIAGLVVGQVGNGSAEYADLISAISDATKEINRLEPRIAEASSHEDRLASYQEEVDRLRLISSLEDIDALLALMRNSEQLGSKIRALEAELKRRSDEIERLNMKIEEQKDPQKVIVLKPSGLGKGLRPSFVECRGKELVVYPQKTRVQASAINGAIFRDHVRTIQRRSGWSVVLLIRPEGVRTFNRARSVAEKLDVRYGYLPLPSKGRIDFGIWNTDEE
jgi:hypothetical protein